MGLGTFTLSDLLGVKYQSQSLLEFTLERMAELVMADMDAHNNLVAQMFVEIADIRTDRYAPYGGVQLTDKMRRVGEFGRPETRKPPISTGNVGFSLMKFQHGLGFTASFLQSATVFDVANAVIGAQDAHILTLYAMLQQALYTPTNDTAYRDEFVDGLAYTIRRLLNADGSPIPRTRNNATFNGATHTHYLASVALDDAAMTALHDTVREHEPPGGLIIAINDADEDTVRALTKFKALTDIRIVQPATTADVYAGAFDPTQMNNTPIGVYKSAYVWKKPWALANYPVCYAPGAPIKPIAFRRSPAPQLQGLRLVSNMIEYPLYAEGVEDMIGVGAQQREAAAVLYVGGGSYVDPAIAVSI